MPFPLDLWLIHPEPEMCDAFRTRFEGLPNVSVLQSRYEALPPHDCFITAANSFGIMTAGIDAAVIHVHGEAFMQRIQHRILDEFLGEQPIGTCLIEPTGNEKFPYIGHAPTMRVPGSINGTDKVYLATWGALLAVYRFNVANQHRIRIVAFPAMGAGFGGVPYLEVARQMAAAYRHYLNPPHRFDWDMVIRREKAISYDAEYKVMR